MSLLFFYLFAVIAVAGALGMVLNTRNTVAAVLSLVVTMVSLGGIYVLLGAFLIGVLQILVYAGAILVLFLFVVMLLNLRQEEFAPQRQLATKIAAAAIGVVVLAQFLVMLQGAFGTPAAVPEDFGSYRQLGIVLFTDYALALEATSLVLLAAMVGAVILAKRKID